MVAFDFLMVKVDFKNLCWGLCTSEKVCGREDEMCTYTVYLVFFSVPVVENLHIFISFSIFIILKKAY